MSVVTPLFWSSSIKWRNLGAVTYIPLNMSLFPHKHCFSSVYNLIQSLTNINYAKDKLWDLPLLLFNLM